MGLFKIFLVLSVPISVMTSSAIKLGKQLPKATRWFGNYIGLSYVYFKCVLKVLKPEDQIPYQMIDLARKASQQSQALRRQLRNTVKKAKQQLNRKHQQVINKFDQKQKQNIRQENEKENQSKEGLKSDGSSGSSIMRELYLAKQALQQKKKLRKDSRKFFQKV